MSFLNPLVLLGLAAAAIPILIHLFHFRRPREVEYSSLTFLREVQATAMRRLRIREWLLLALRLLAIVCLVLAFAQPIFTSALGSGLGDEGATSRAYVLDNSQSMTFRDEQGAYLDQAKAALVGLLDGAGPGDEHALIPTASPPGHIATLRRSAGLVQDATLALEAQPGASPLTVALARAASVLEDAQNPRREIVVLSDLQESTLTDSVEGEQFFAPTLPEDVDVALVPVGGREQANTAVTDVRPRSQILEPGQPIEMNVAVRRFGGEEGPLGVRLILDGAPVGEVAAEFDVDDTTGVPFTVPARSRGWTSGEATIENDDAPWDDVRYFTFTIPPPARVVLVGGAGSRVDLVRLALEVAAESGSVVVQEMSEQELAVSELEETDAVVWVGPSDASPVATVSRFVEEGGGLLVFPSESTGPLNALMGVVGGGEVVAIEGESGGESIAGTVDPDLEHPLFAGVFEEGGATRLERIEVWRAARYEPAGLFESSLIRLDNGAPFLQEIRHGEGAALFVATAPDPAWSDLPNRGLFVPLVYRSVAWLAAGSEAAEGASVTVREAASIRVDDVRAEEPLRLVSPSGVEVTPPQRSVPGGVVLEVGSELTEAGVYVVMQGEEELRRVAVNESSDESNPSVLSPQEAADRLERLTGRSVRVLEDRKSVV